MLTAGPRGEKDILPVAGRGQDVADQRERAGHAHEPAGRPGGGPRERLRRGRRHLHPEVRRQERAERRRGAARGFPEAVSTTPAASGASAPRIPAASLSREDPDHEGDRPAAGSRRAATRRGRGRRPDCARRRGSPPGRARKTWKRPGQRAPRRPARIAALVGAQRARPPRRPAARYPAGRRPAARTPRRRAASPDPRGRAAAPRG